MGKGGLLGGLAGMWRASPTWLKVVIVAAVIFAANLILGALSGGDSRRDPHPVIPASRIDGPQKTDYDKCVERGIDYFKKIGSYPWLSDDRSADKVAAERCGRTLTAF